MEQDFRQAKREWYCENGDCLTMASLDKSPNGGQYYLDFGASPRQLLGSERPREYQLHFRTRLESIVPNSRELLTAMDLEDQSVNSSHRQRVLETALRDCGVPLLLQLRTVDGIARVTNLNAYGGRFLVLPALQDLLCSRRTPQ